MMHPTLEYMIQRISFRDFSRVLYVMNILFLLPLLF
jgi:hypothetical protein